MFDEGRRNISLGGRSAKKTKEDILRETRELRLQKELEKRKLDSAKKIQASFKRFQCQKLLNRLCHERLFSLRDQEELTNESLHSIPFFIFHAFPASSLDRELFPFFVRTIQAINQAPNFDFLLSDRFCLNSFRIVCHFISPLSEISKDTILSFVSKVLQANNSVDVSTVFQGQTNRDLIPSLISFFFDLTLHSEEEQFQVIVKIFKKLTQADPSSSQTLWNCWKRSSTLNTEEKRPITLILSLIAPSDDYDMLLFATSLQKSDRAELVRTIVKSIDPETNTDHSFLIRLIRILVSLTVYRQVTSDGIKQDDYDDEEDTEEIHEALSDVDSLIEMLIKTFRADETSVANREIVIFLFNHYCMMRDPDSMKKLISNLVFSTNFVPIAWNSIRSFSASADSASSSSSSSSSSPSSSVSVASSFEDQMNIVTELCDPSSQSWNGSAEMISMFSLCFTLFLQSHFDREILKLFPPSELRFIFHNLLRVSISFWWDKNPKLKRVHAIPISSCLRTLFNYNDRLKFLKATEWLSKDIDATSARVEELEDTSTFDVVSQIPFILSNLTRQKIFLQLIYDRFNSRYYFDSFPIAVVRGEELQSAFEHLSNKDSSVFFKRFRVSYRGIDNHQEDGIDGGGLYKEFMNSALKQACDPARGLFSLTEDQKLFPNPEVRAIEPEFPAYYRLIGMLLGKAIGSGVLVDIQFSRFFLAKILNRSNLNYLQFLFPSMHRNLMNLLEYEGDVENDMGLTFSITSDYLGHQTVHDLLPNGRNYNVTNSNRLLYVTQVSQFYLSERIKAQTTAFIDGFNSVLEPNFVRMFNEDELQLLISGLQVIDLRDLRENTMYNNGYHENHPSILLFWQVVHDFSIDEQRLLLKFATSSPHAPLFGFKSLFPKFCIAQTEPDMVKLPSSATCANLLRLPPYDTYELMRSKILYAINSESGFELS